MFIGVTGYNHESSAALVDKNGVLVDFYREESLSRIKGCLLYTSPSPRD